jgi:hypothetical protein
MNYNLLDSIDRRLTRSQNAGEGKSGKTARDAIEKRMRRLQQRGKEEKKIIPPSAWGTDGNNCV